jgi:hypothetical protein
MLALCLPLGLLLNMLGIGLFCWVILALAANALPFFVVLSIGMMALHGGAGVIGALLIGTAVGVQTLVIGQVTVAMTKSFALRIAIPAAFAVPATVAGYHVVLGLSEIAMSSPTCRELFGCLGAVCVGVAAWMRLIAFAESR